MSTVVTEVGDVFNIEVYESGVTLIGGTLMVGNTRIKQKGPGNVDNTSIEDGDIIEFYDDLNDDRKVEGIVLDATDYKAYDAPSDKYTNMKTYQNIKPI